MSEYSKKFRILELKWLLPRVNKTRKKEKFLEGLKNEYIKISEKRANIILIKANMYKRINSFEGDFDDEIKQIENSKKEALEEIIADGVLDDAKEYAKKIVKQIMLAAGFEEVLVY